jgi:hypothetical protein
VRRVNKLFTVLAAVLPPIARRFDCRGALPGMKVTRSRCLAASGCEMRHGATWEARVKVHRPAPLGLNAEGSQCLKGFLDGKLRMLAHGALDQSALVCRECREYFAVRIA